MLVQDQRWKDLELGPSRMQGKGVFAARPFEAGELITTVEGTLHRGAYDGDFAVGPTWFGGGHGVWIEPLPDSPPRYLNHACEPNAVVIERVRIVAKRSIAPGEEITIDYASTEEDPEWHMPCSCGSAHCRRVVRGEATFPR